MTNVNTAQIRRISKQLKELVHDTRVPYDEISKESDVSVGTIFNFVNGTIGKPHAATIAKLEEFLSKHIGNQRLGSSVSSDNFSFDVWLSGCMPRVAVPRDTTTNSNEKNDSKVNSDAQKNEVCDSVYISPEISLPAQIQFEKGSLQALDAFLIPPETDDIPFLANVIVGGGEEGKEFASSYYFYEFPQVRKNDAFNFQGEIFLRLTGSDFLSCLLTIIAFGLPNSINILESMNVISLVQLTIRILGKHKLFVLVDATDLNELSDGTRMFWRQLFVQQNLKSRIIWVGQNRSIYAENHYHKKMYTINLKPDKVSQ